LYVDSVIYNYALNLHQKRNDKKYESFTNEELFNKLSSIDFNLAKKITINNRKRLLRALQLNEQSDNTYNSIKKNPPKYDYLLIVCDISRSDLYDQINHRVDAMLNNG